MNCIIIDDEPMAVKVIESYCESIDSITVLGTFTNALDALDFIKDNSVDLIFSDIEMPHINGVDFIKTLEHKRPIFIFTTAYPQYALDGFELNAIDYLVKPIPFPRFVTAIQRAKERLKLKESIASDSTHNSKKVYEDDFIFVKSEYDNLKLLIDDITYIQGLKDYLKIHTLKSGAILTLMNFKDFQAKLPGNLFIRIHRSYIVNISKIELLQRNKVIIEGQRIPIGENYKEAFYKRLGI
ncbi:LytR/AlgR family response regulator transcription factor [Gelidibacter japonicus]|jgi:DNA-binding LytR/AlgR family response regulator|uniref:LytR/AlgR family response regulator transcription factor n=1 Tax=Gelidibacter japonicus TaxID=1962232 RepID=UPI0020223740|nr:LytTR family DNA-binding domain-containing protein [Gelidibacter japonicus]MCL8007271.1 LytTR family DNA-binding domain-containing protein [Gelidibacter japonicus]